MSAAPSAETENNKYAYRCLSLTQMWKWINASVRHADATVDQMVVIQLIERLWGSSYNS